MYAPELALLEGMLSKELRLIIHRFLAAAMRCFMTTC